MYYTFYVGKYGGGRVSKTVSVTYSYASMYGMRYAVLLLVCTQQTTARLSRNAELIRESE